MPHLGVIRLLGDHGVSPAATNCHLECSRNNEHLGPERRDGIWRWQIIVDPDHMPLTDVVQVHTSCLHAFLDFLHLQMVCDSRQVLG